MSKLKNPAPYLGELGGGSVCHLVLGAPPDAAPVEAPTEPRLVRAVGAVRGGGVRRVRAPRQHLAGHALRVEGLHLHGGDHGLAALHPGGGVSTGGRRRSH